MDKHLQRFEIKAEDTSEGTFVAYGNVFNVIDEACDMTLKGAFANTIEEHKRNGTMPKFLAQHGHTTMPIGIITDMKEDEHGLRIEGKFALTTQAGREAYDLVVMGAIDEFSIGFITRNYDTRVVDGIKVRALLDVSVKEISLVTFACNPDSKIQEVKNAVESGSPVTERMVQKALQESGLSKRTAENAVNQIKHAQDEPEQEEKSMSKDQEQKSLESNIQTPDNTMEKKASYYMKERLQEPVVCMACFYDVVGYLSPEYHGKIVEIAEQGRLDMLAKLGMVDEETEQKSEEITEDSDVEEKVNTTKEADAEESDEEEKESECKEESDEEEKESECKEESDEEEMTDGEDTKGHDEDEVEEEKSVDFTLDELKSLFSKMEAK